MLAPIGMHPDGARKRNAPGHIARRACADLAALVMTTEALDVAIEKSERAGLIVECAGWPVVHAARGAQFAGRFRGRLSTRGHHELRRATV